MRVLDDYDRLFDLANARAHLDPSATTILKDNISWHFPFPAANTTPWQLEGTIRACARADYDDLVCVQNKTVVTDAFKGEDLNHYLPIFKHYDMPVLYNFKDEDMRWVRLSSPRRRMHVLRPDLPRGHPGPRLLLRQEHRPPADGEVPHLHHHHRGDEERLRRPAEHPPALHPLLDPRDAGRPAGHPEGDPLRPLRGHGRHHRRQRARARAPCIPVIKNVMLASADQVAIDAVAAKMMGFDPMSIEYIRLAHEDGLGVGDPRDIEVVGDTEPGDGVVGLQRGRQRRQPRRRPRVVRPAQALPEAVLPHAAGEPVHLRHRGVPRLLPLADPRSAGVRDVAANTAWGELFQEYHRTGPRAPLAAR